MQDLVNQAGHRVGRKGLAAQEHLVEHRAEREEIRSAVDRPASNLFLASGVILWQHNPNVPIGKPLEAREDEKGLWFRATIEDTSAGMDARKLMKAGVINHGSISRYSAKLRASV